MEINIYRLRGVERELRRLNDNLELILLHTLGLTPVKRRGLKVAAGKSEVLETDEELDFLDELLGESGRSRDELRKFLEENREENVLR